LSNSLRPIIATKGVHVCQVISFDFIGFWVNPLVVVNGDQWKSSEFIGHWTGTNELHPHFVIVQAFLTRVMYIWRLIKLAKITCIFDFCHSNCLLTF
jgi:hypothetical protein